MKPDLLLALGTGLLGGFGHCVGMCGPLVGAVSLAAGPSMGQRRLLAGHLLYNAGRITTYALLGGTMGMAGSFVNVAGRMAGLQDAVAVAAGALMILLGLGAAGVAGWASRVEARAAGHVFSLARTMLAGGGPGRFYPLGLVMGFLPCGLSYTAFLGAAATGGPAQGLAFALAFALGTVPAMLAAGAVATALGARLRGALYRAGGLLVALLGALFVARGLGWHAPL